MWDISFNKLKPILKSLGICLVVALYLVILITKVSGVAQAALQNQIKHSIVILPVPFTVQAPQANWSAPYQDACEEASMIMAAEYLKGGKKGKLDLVYANREILKLVQWQKKNRGFYESTTASEVVSILKDYYSIQARVVKYEAAKIKQALDKKQIVLLPAAGRKLGNQYFQRPGPLYHMLVVKGYQGDEFITNDPGTKRGENFRYTEKVLADAVHDWNNGEVIKGESVMIVVDGLINKKANAKTNSK